MDYAETAYFLPEAYAESAYSPRDFYAETAYRVSNPAATPNRGRPPALETIPYAQEFLLVENNGQWSGDAKLGRLHAVSTVHDGARLYFFDRGISIVHEGLAAASARRIPGAEHYTSLPPQLQRYRVDLRFLSARIPADVLFSESAQTRFRYYIPGSPLGVEAAGSRVIEYRDLYPGIDLSCRIENGGLKYEFHVHPGADPSRIRLRYDGVNDGKITGSGGLALRHGAGTVQDSAPVAWQPAGAVHMPCDIAWAKDGHVFSFNMGAYDRTRTLVIDPFLQWSTFLGGKLSDYARDVTVDGKGGMILCGYTAGNDFPVTPGALQAKSLGNFDLFITAFNRERKMRWSTYYGGTGSEENPCIARAEKDGGLYISGSTSSRDLPVSPEATQPRNGGRYDAFLLALTSEGQRRWSTYFGGSYSDECSDIAVAGDGSIYVAGGTYSTNFPVTPDAVQTSNGGDYDMFVAQFTAKGTRQWASYIGGWSMDYATSIAVDEAGDLFLGGRTESSNFPAVSQGLQSSYGGGSFDGIVLRISGKTHKLLWSTYVGGEEEDNVDQLLLDAKGNIVITGYTASKRFPIAGKAEQRRQAGLIDAFLARMDGRGKIQWATYLGGSEVDKATGLAVDKYGNIMIAGFTGSKNFPLAGKGFQEEKKGGYDVFLSQFGTEGAYIWGTLFGGETHDIAYGLAIDAKGNSIVVGGTESRGFRTAGNIYQGDLAGLTDAFVLRIIFNEPAANAGRDTTICYGGSAQLGGEAVGGQPPYRYSWAPSSSLSSATDIHPQATPSKSQEYVLVVTDAEGAVARDTVMVHVSSPPVVDAGNDRALCPGGSEALQANVRDGRPPYTYTWSPAEGLNNVESANPVATPGRSTRYVITVRDALGCTASDSVMVRVHPAVAVDAGRSLEACANAPVRLRAAVTGGQAPFRYSWKPAVGLDNPGLQSPQLMPQKDAVYIVTVTDANGCTGSDTLSVSVHRPPVVDAGDNQALCAGDELKLRARVSGGKPPYTYAWSPGTGLSSTKDLSPVASPKNTTMYVLSATDRNGCIVRDSVLVSVHPQPVLKMATDVDLCSSTDVQIGAEATTGTPPYRYSWKPATGLSAANIAMPRAAPDRSTTYTVVAEDANGCRVQSTVRVTVQPRPRIRLRDKERVCLGADLKLEPDVSGGKPPYTYAWSPSFGLSAANIARPVARPASPVTYTLRVTDARGCVGEAKVDVEVLAPPAVNAGEDVVLCEGTPVTLDARVTGGRPPYRVVWSPNEGLSSVRKLDPTVRTTQSRVYTITITDKNGCVATDEITVQVAPPPRVNAGKDVTTCSGTPVALNAAVSGGTPPYRYQWAPAAGLSAPMAATTTAQPDRSTRYTLTVTDARGCVATDEVSVDVQAAPVITAPKELTICRNQGQRIELSASGGRKPYRYEWTPRNGLSDGSSATPVANPIQTTTYTVTVTDQNGCRVFKTITVTVLPCNKSDAGDDETMCDGGEVRIGAAVVDTMYGAQYSWKPAAGLSSATSAQPVARPAKTTRYVLSKSNRFDCVSRDTVLITVFPSPKVEAGKDLVLCPGSSGDLKGKVSGGTPPISFRWEPATGLTRSDALTARASPLESTTYRLIVTDANGCMAEDSLTVRVPPALAVDMQRTVEVCEGNEIRLGGRISGGQSPYEVMWSPAKGLSDRKSPTPAFSGSASGIYFMTVTDAVGCEFIDTVAVTVFPAPVAEIRTEGPPEFCEGESLTLAAPAGYAGYAWSNGAKSSSITVKEGGSYAVTVTDAHGCNSTSQSLSVTRHSRPTPAIAARGPLTFCEGDSVLLDAGKGYIAYSWSTGATTRRIAAHASGTYSVSVVGDGDCEAQAEPVTVTVHPLPVASMLRRLDTLIAAPAEKYQWLRDGRVLPDARGRMHVADASGTYVLRTSNAQGCSAESSPMKLEFASATVDLPDLRVHAGDTVDISLRLITSKGLDRSGADTLLALMPLKKKSVRILSGGDLWTDDDGEEYVRFHGSYHRGKKTLAVVRMVVEEERGVIPLELVSVRWLNGLVRTIRRDGKIRLQ
ncbi:SBBP repeat-containing protein [bacterium]|nr:SBBP repeat-containing protein [bacterium]